MSLKAPKSDIQSYISRSVKTKIESKELRIRSPTLESEIITKLVDKSQGMFLWVFFQIQELCDATSDSSIGEILRTLPEDLGQTYERILSRIVESKQRKQMVQRVFDWIHHAKRPLKISEMQEAVAFDVSDENWDIHR